MGVRTIGGKQRAALGFRAVAAGDGESGVEEPRVDTDTIDESHKSNAADNGSEQSDGGFTDPETIAGAGSDSDPAPYGYTKSGRRRNRPIASATRTGASRSTTKTTDSVAAMLFTVHTVAASFLKMPILKLDKESCKELAEATMQVTELYEIPLLDDKGMAWLNLASVAARVYIFDNKKPELISKAPVSSATNEPIPMPVFMTGAGKVN